MKRYAYKIVSGNESERMLNNLGEQGWRVIAVSANKFGHKWTLERSSEPGSRDSVTSNVP